jgi:zinc protease
MLAVAFSCAWFAPSPALADGHDAAATQPALPPPPTWSAPAPTSLRTASGIEVVVLPRHELPLVSLLVTVKAGAALDPPGSAGLASATAMMLQDGGAGARTAPEVAAAVEDLGAELHVECDRDAAELQLAVLSRSAGTALALLGDLVARPRFDEAEWMRARTRRVAEIVHRGDEPRYIADAVFDRVLFGDQHPYGQPSIGTRAAVERLTAADLRRFYATHYGPRTTSVTLVGDITLERARTLVEQAFQGWRATAAPAPTPTPTAAAATGSRLVIVDRPGAPQTELRVGHVGIARASADFPAMYLLETVLGGSFTSRLNENLREKHGYTYGVRAHFFTDEAPGPFEVRTAVRTDVTAPAVQEIAAELRGMHAPIAADEASKGRALVRNALVDGFTGGSEAAGLLADLQLHGLPLDGWSRLPAALDALTAPLLARAAGRLFHPDALVIVAVGDAKKIEAALRRLPFVRAVEHRDADGKLLP